MDGCIIKNLPLYQCNKTVLKITLLNSMSVSIGYGVQSVTDI